MNQNADLPCPIMTQLKLVEEMLDAYADRLDDIAWTRGRVLVWREIAQKVHAMLPCQPNVADNGMLTCSLGYVIGDVLTAVFSPVAAFKPMFGIELDKLGTDDEAKTAYIGAML